MKFCLAAILLFVNFFVLGQSLTTYRSTRSVDETVDRIVATIKDKKLVYLETVEYDDIANRNGMEISPTRLILFEDVNLATELLACQQATALDMPMKILVWEEFGDVYVGFFDPKVMMKRFILTDCDKIITSLSRLNIRLVNEALKEDGG